MMLVEAVVIDATHLELKKPLSGKVGKRYIISIFDPESERKEALKQLEAAYLSMTDEQRQLEIDLAEEGLRGQPDFLEQFVNEEEENWWQ